MKHTEQPTKPMAPTIVAGSQGTGEPEPRNRTTGLSPSVGEGRERLSWDVPEFRARTWIPPKGPDVV
jgi:hypothetical protein